MNIAQIGKYQGVYTSVGVSTRLDYGHVGRKRRKKQDIVMRKNCRLPT